MPECLSERVTEWFSAAVERIGGNLETLTELEQTSSREAHWPAVRSQIEALRNENAFLRIGYELMLELRDTIIREHRERNRDVVESVPVLLSPGVGASGAVSAERFSVAGARSGRTDSSVPNHGRPPVQQPGIAFVPSENCQGSFALLSENQIIGEFLIRHPLDNLE